jgi:hypothetical protein
MDLQALKKIGISPRSQAIAEVLRRIQASPPRLLDPWLAFPQNGCSYGFGKPPRPVPIGALAILWDEGTPFSQPCPDCADTLRMVSFGGLLSVGGGRLFCPGCDAEFFQSIGGLTVVAAAIGATKLRGTEFAPSVMRFGGAVGSKGCRLLEQLGLPPIVLGEEDGVVRLEDGQRIRLDFDARAKRPH